MAQGISVWLVHWSHAMILIAAIVAVWSNLCNAGRLKKLIAEMQRLRSIEDALFAKQSEQEQTEERPSGFNPGVRESDPIDYSRF